MFMRKKAVIIGLIVLLLFIWGNSCLPRTLASQESGRVTGWLRPLLEPLIGEENMTEHFVRKLAHFTEYALLGCLLWRLMQLLPITAVWRILYAGMTAMMAALIDETIQIFSGRGPMIQDVWLDFGGAVFGGAVLALLSRITHKKRST